MEFDITYKDDSYIAIDKPSGILTHPSLMNPKETSVMKELRNQIGRWVYPVHRLDRATSGVLLFALSSDAARDVAVQFAERKVRKTYLAIVRGYAPESGVIDYPLRKDNIGDKQEAITEFKTIKYGEFPFANKRFSNSRYSMVEVKPKTGRMHQIRRHMAHLTHPLIGDTTYGDGVHNQIFRANFDSHRLLLFATELVLENPIDGREWKIKSKQNDELNKLLEKLKWY